MVKQMGRWLRVAAVPFLSTVENIAVSTIQSKRHYIVEIPAKYLIYGIGM